MPKTVKRAKRALDTPRKAPRETAGRAGRKGAKDESSGRQDAYGRYLKDVNRHGEDLLSPAQELAVGRLLSEYVALVIDEILKDLREAERILVNPRERPGLRARARALIQRVNPDGLTGAALDEAVARLMQSTEADDFFEMYAPEDGKELRDYFINANLKLAVSMAKKYDRGALAIGELVQEGNIGLMHAVLRFDHRRGFRFSTYAGWWIRHAVGRAISDKGRAVRIPVHMTEFAALVYKLRSRLAAELGREPEDEEIVARLRKEEKSSSHVGRGDDGGLLLEKVRKLGSHLRTPISLDQPVRTDDGTGDTMHETMPDESAEEPPVWATLGGSGAVGALRKAMTGLRPIEIDVLRQRFGIDEQDEEERTFKEIGDKYGLSRERIRQIQNVALDKLRRDKGVAKMIREVNAF